MDHWDALGIAPDSSERTIKRAYAKILKTIDLERDPGAFMELREAYETALHTLDRPLESISAPKISVRFEDLYVYSTPLSDSEVINRREDQLSAEVIELTKEENTEPAEARFLEIMRSAEMENLVVRAAFEESLTRELGDMERIPLPLLAVIKSELNWDLLPDYFAECAP